ncbi:MAG: hypothetical protein GX752_04380 [Clostridium sp.]|nr:hypothetical protein [Clostridium sp.]
MSNKISLKQIVEKIDTQSVEMNAFLNKNSKEIFYISEEEFIMAEDDEPIDKLPEWLQEQIRLVEEVLYGDDWISLPSKLEIHEYNIMEKFCFSLDDEDISNAMCNLIKGKGAFRRFKDYIQKYNIEDDWYNFRNKILEEMAIEWCEENNISYIK